MTQTTRWISATLLALAFSRAGFPPASTAAALQPRTDINPAVLYWQGFSFYPDPAKDLPKDLLADPPRVPREEAEPALRRFDRTFQMLRRAAQMKVPCDWGIDLADGPEALIPNLVKIRQCAQAGQVRAHYALEAGRDQEAADDLAAVLVLGRNAGTDGTLVSTMVGIAVEKLVIATVAKNFHRFGPRSLISLTQQIDAAPKRPTVKQAMNTEKAAFLEWYVAKIEGFRDAYPNDEPKAIEAARDLLVATLDQGNTIDRTFQAADGSIAKLIAYFKELGPLYDSILRATDAAPNQVDQQTRLADELTKAHPNHIARIIFPNVSKARKSELGAIAQAAMLRAAIALRLEGEKGFEKIQDPFGDGPFTLRRLPGDSGEIGFELDSKLSALMSGKIALKFLEDAPSPQTPKADFE